LGKGTSNMGYTSYNTPENTPKWDQGRTQIAEGTQRAQKVKQRRLSTGHHSWLTQIKSHIPQPYQNHQAEKPGQGAGQPNTGNNQTWAPNLGPHTTHKN